MLACLGLGLCLLLLLLLLLVRCCCCCCCRRRDAICFARVVWGRGTDWEGHRCNGTPYKCEVFSSVGVEHRSSRERKC
ncbi:hypothetical protein K440DRAFT_619939 [Wilcoxina mikolae CBS 423.85]|nr:hypothetical protein K440DRAFT_619939 [Wilcoxina mikolae CBS 423.85]